MKYAIFASYGNDSIALVQWAHEKRLTDVVVAYSDTGWAADGWAERVSKAEEWVADLGFRTSRIHSEGMAGLLRRKSAWPRGGGGRFQFCTENLKEIPALAWLDEADPEKEATCMIGVRREESQNRASHPEWVEESERHGGRNLWAPLVLHTEQMRDDLIRRTPFKVLPWKSKECWPCVNANNKELRLLEPDRIAHIAALEQEMGINSKGNARVMFSPRRHGGAVGIQAVVDHAQKNNDDLFSGGCDGGWCGT